MPVRAHTPGQWGWTYDGSGDYSLGPKDDPQVGPVAHVYTRHQSEQCEADVTLLAAAPDLLAALKVITDQYVSLVASGDCGNWDAERDDQVVLARAAIAKAERRE